MAALDLSGAAMSQHYKSCVWLDLLAGCFLGILSAVFFCADAVATVTHSPEEAVRCIYMDILERPADVNAVKVYGGIVTELPNDGLRLVYLAVLTSDEFRSKLHKLSADEQIDYLFRHLFHRAAQRAELSSYQHQITQNNGYEAVLRSLVYNSGPKYQQLLCSVAPGSNVVHHVPSKVDLALHLQLAGYICQKTGLHKQEFDYFQRSAIVDPNSAKTHVELGWIHLHANNLRKALEEYNQALKLDPNCTRALRERIVVYDMEGKLREALSDTDRLIDIFSKKGGAGDAKDLATSFQNRAWIKLRLGSPTESSADFASALTHNPALAKDPVYNKLRGTCFSVLKQDSKAIECYTAAILSAPNDAKTYHARAIAYDHLLDFGNAIKDLSRAIALAPTDYELYYERAEQYKKFFCPDKAIADYGAAIAHGYRTGEALIQRAGLYMREKHQDKALQDLSECLAQNPVDCVALYMRGKVYMAVGKYAQAIHDFTEQIRLMSSNSSANVSARANCYSMRAQAYAAAGRHDLALKDFSEEVKLTPDLPGPYYRRAAAYDKVGNHAAAVKDRAMAKQVESTY